jgi:hypothetical protein
MQLNSKWILNVLGNISRFLALKDSNKQELLIMNNNEKKRKMVQ